MKKTLLGSTGALWLALAGTAAAHITTNPAEGPSDGFATVGFQVPHGCEDSPTTKLRIQIPPSVPSVTPERSPFWTVSTKTGRKDKVELHGETVTQGTSEVIYTAKQPLPPHEMDVLSLSLKLPAGEGESIYFPTIQTCEQGETRWIQIPQEGESEEDLESPAPAVVLTAGEGGHSEPATREVQTSGVAATADDEEGAPVWLAVVALALGALGLVAGVAGLMAGRRRAA